MTISAMITGLALALTVGAVPVLSQEGDGESSDALAQIARLAKESANEHVSIWRMLGSDFLGSSGD